MISPLSPRSGHRALPIGNWPALDRQAWDMAHRQAGFLEKGGHGADWRPASQKAARGAYARWLGWLVIEGGILEAEAPPIRITPARMGSYVTFLQEKRASVTVASYLGILCMTVLALFPESDWCWLQAVQAKMQRMASPVRNKQDRLVPADQLMQLGLDLMTQARRVLDLPRTQDVTARRWVAAARNYRDGLLIALLSSRPLRVKNLLAIEIGEHLRQWKSQTTLRFPASETKNKHAFHTTWPESLSPALEQYLRQVRPILIAATAPIDPARPPRPPGATLWVGQGGTPLTPGGLFKALGRHTRSHFGHAINAHLFRDCVATTLTNQDPNHARYAAQLLGHKNLQSTERNYISADSHIALHRHHDLISAMRSSTRQRGRGGSGC